MNNSSSSVSAASAPAKGPCLKQVRYIFASGWHKAKGKHDTYDLHAVALLIQPPVMNQKFMHGDYVDLHALSSDWPDGTPPCARDGVIFSMYATDQYSKYRKKFFMLKPLTAKSGLTPFLAIAGGATADTASMELIKTARKRNKKGKLMKAKHRWQLADTPLYSGRVVA